MRSLYADFNDMAQDGTLPLSCRGSLEDIANSRDLKDGEEVVLSDGELRVRAKIFKQDDGVWVAKSDWKFTESQ